MSERTPCRHGRGCRDKNDGRHSSTYSHPDDQLHRDHGTSRQDKIPCKFGSRCHNRDHQHRATYSHPAP